MIGIVFEGEMSREQAEELAQLMAQGRATRPRGVLTASLIYEDGVGRLIAYWKDKEMLDRYLSEAEVPRGTELMRRVGVEPRVRVVDVLELG